MNQITWRTYEFKNYRNVDGIVIEGQYCGFTRSFFIPNEDITPAMREYAKEDIASVLHYRRARHIRPDTR